MSREYSIFQDEDIQHCGDCGIYIEMTEMFDGFCDYTKIVKQKSDCCDVGIGEVNELFMRTKK